MAALEQFVKNVWPAFRDAGTRPKAAPIMLPIFSKSDYWSTKSAGDRLSAFSNLKKWIVDDLSMAPDYWVMSSYPFCDPAPDGTKFFERIVAILGPDNARRIVSSDLKGPGHEKERLDTILSSEDVASPKLLDWHIQKCLEYEFAGYWVWAYQDTLTDKTGLRGINGMWKQELVDVIRAGSEER